MPTTQQVLISKYRLEKLPGLSRNSPLWRRDKIRVERPSRMLYSHLHPAVFSVLAEDLVHWLSEQLVVRGTNKVAQTCCGYL